MRAEAAVFSYILPIGWVCEAPLLRCNAKLKEMFSLQKEKRCQRSFITYHFKPDLEVSVVS